MRSRSPRFVGMFVNGKKFVICLRYGSLHEGFFFGLDYYVSLLLRRNA